MKKIVIVESPTKTKSIERYLGDDYTVVSSKGHIRDLAKSGPGRLGVDIENNFEPKYVVSKDKKDVVTSLKKITKNADEVYLATDPDREGEAISWHLAQELKLDESRENRVVFNEITKKAVLKAFENPRKIDMDVVRSQETRRILDRIIGFKLSRLLQSKIKSKSAGRVQSVALKLIVEREKEIQAFQVEEYWSIHATFEKDNKEVVADLTKIDGQKAEILNEEQANTIINECQSPFKVSEVNQATKTRQPKLPFTTSTLQQEASTKLGFSAKRTMVIAQKLYEGIKVDNAPVGLITYMRTDSTRLSDGFVADAKQHIEAVYGKEYQGFYRVKKDKNAQDAHEAIRPTNLEYHPDKIKDALTNDEYKLYRIIYLRAIASLMAPAKMNTMTVTFNQGKYNFTARGSIMVFDGYLKAYGDYEQNKDAILPIFESGESHEAKHLEGKQHFTEPPLRYSEARLIKEMEELGIGRPSTYASIIDMIQKRAYVRLDKSSEGSKTKVFFPTDKGILTDQELSKYFSSIINVKYTAEMEKDLDKIAEQELDHVKVLKEFYQQFEPLVEEAYEKMEKIEPEKVGELCPECGNELVYREGRFGKFISCSTFPTCKYTRKIDNGDQPKEEPELLEELCPECGSQLIKRKSRYGNYFVGCSAFPKCRYIKKDESKIKKETKKKTTKKASKKKTKTIKASKTTA